jgi:acyl carrier protein
MSGDIVQQLKQFVLAEFLPGEDPAALTETTPLISSRVLDSISTLKLIAHVEETYGISVDAYEASSSFDTIADIVKLIESKKS